MAMVSYTWETLPPADQEAIDRVAAMKDEDIDFSDMPEITSLEGLRRRVPSPDRGGPPQAKAALTCELDADVAAWLRQAGADVQARVNAILREAMTAG